MRETGHNPHPTYQAFGGVQGLQVFSQLLVRRDFLNSVERGFSFFEREEKKTEMINDVVSKVRLNYKYLSLLTPTYV